MSSSWSHEVLRKEKEERREGERERGRDRENTSQPSFLVRKSVK